MSHISTKASTSSLKRNQITADKYLHFEQQQLKRYFRKSDAINNIYHTCCKEVNSVSKTHLLHFRTIFYTQM